MSKLFIRFVIPSSVLSNSLIGPSSFSIYLLSLFGLFANRAPATSRSLSWNTDDDSLRIKFEEFGVVEEAVCLFAAAIVSFHTAPT